MTLFQSLATSAGYDPTVGPGSSCTPSGQCVVSWMGGTKSVSSVVLIANGISFAVCLAAFSLCFRSQPLLFFHQVMTLIFTTIGSAADYSTFGRWLLLIITCICWAAQFASMSLTCTCLFVNIADISTMST
jgi:hypothetical protein